MGFNSTNLHPHPICHSGASRNLFNADGIQDDTSGPIDSHTIQFGATYTFGSDSLQDNERHGAAIDLPAFMRWQGVAAGPLE